MIVRINQLNAVSPEPDAGWASAGLLGPLPMLPDSQATGDLPFHLDGAAGSVHPRAFELLILGQDEQSRPLTEAFRQSQLRQMIPQALAALREPGEEVVVRLDGPFASGELLAALAWLTDADGRGRFAVSGVAKLEDRPLDALGSIRLHPSPQRLAALCQDPALGLDRSVRLRAFCVPESLVHPLMELESTGDPRWANMLSGAGLVLGTTRGLRSLHLFSRGCDTAGIKSRIMQRLKALASAATGTASPV